MLHLVSETSFLLHSVNFIPTLTLFSFCFRHFHFL